MEEPTLPVDLPETTTADLRPIEERVRELLEAGQVEAAYVLVGGVLPTPEALVVPNEIRLQHWAEAFAKLANLYQIPACWVVFQDVPGMGVQVINGGHPGALQFLGTLLNKPMGPDSVSGAQTCITCGRKIPPGRPLRQCTACRDTEATPKLILPGS